MIDLLCNLACSNKQLAHLAGVRIKNGRALATDGITFAVMEDFPSDIDCFVNGEALKSAMKLMTDPEFELESRNLVIRSKNKNARVPLLDLRLFLVDPDILYEGYAYQAPSLLEALRVGVSFSKADALKASISSLYLDGKRLFATDSDILVRADCPLEAEIPIDSIISIPRIFAKLAVDLDRTFQDVLLNDQCFVMRFDKAWISTTKEASEVPLDFEEFFSDFEQTDLVELDVDTKKELKSMCKNIPADAVIAFDDDGISSSKERGIRIKLEGSFPFECKTRMSLMKKAQPYLERVGFSDRKFVFAGDGMQGYIGTM